MHGMLGASEGCAAGVAALCVACLLAGEMLRMHSVTQLRQRRRARAPAMDARPLCAWHAGLASLHFCCGDLSAPNHICHVSHCVGLAIPADAFHAHALVGAPLDGDRSRRMRARTPTHLGLRFHSRVPPPHNTVHACSVNQLTSMVRVIAWVFRGITGAPGVDEVARHELAPPRTPTRAAAASPLKTHSRQGTRAQ